MICRKDFPKVNDRAQALAPISIPLAPFRSSRLLIIANPINHFDQRSSSSSLRSSNPIEESLETETTAIMADADYVRLPHDALATAEDLIKTRKLIEFLDLHRTPKRQPSSRKRERSANFPTVASILTSTYHHHRLPYQDTPDRRQGRQIAWKTPNPDPPRPAQTKY